MNTERIAAYAAETAINSKLETLNIPDTIPAKRTIKAEIIGISKFLLAFSSTTNGTVRKAAAKRETAIRQVMLVIKTVF